MEHIRFFLHKLDKDHIRKDIIFWLNKKNITHHSIGSYFGTVNLNEEFSILFYMEFSEYVVSFEKQIIEEYYK